MEKTLNKKNGLEKIMEGFTNPQNEYTPIPFWFLNDTLTENELIRQIRDFNDKGVNGFVIHPRIGVPKELEYLSDEFMKFVTVMVEEAKKLDMKVVLYDEAMYPSGSAHGMVVKNHPEYASIGLKKLEAKGISPSIRLNDQEAENLLTALAVKVTADGYDLSEVKKLKVLDGTVGITSEDDEVWAVYAFLEKFTGGHIRGIHFGEDDGEGNEPPSADLLNPKAVEEFIRLTHERYYEVLKAHFGKTVIGMFTDEPDIMGRDHEVGLMAWTKGFMSFAADYGLKEEELFLLWEDASAKGSLGTLAKEVQNKYKTAVNKRMEDTYYRPLSVWCEDHKIALTGHPHESDDIGFMKYFQLPAQDVVWRWVAPENELGIAGEHSTMAKCTSDSARHRGIRRNGNECFACCGADGIEWSFTVRDMKWYMDWLFVRGVNLLYPHAFFYSVDGERRFGERPPDVGPNNTWWPYYRQISDYMKRMSFLMTDFTNSASVAILCEAHHLPWKAAKMLFENQIEFNYLEEELCNEEECHIEDGKLMIRDQIYSVIVMENADRYFACKEILDKYVEQGGRVVVLDSDEAVRLQGTKAWIAENENAFITQLRSFGADRVRSSNPAKNLRVTHGMKEQNEIYILTNEGETAIDTALLFPFTGKVTCLDAWKGTIKDTKVVIHKNQSGLSSVTFNTGLFADGEDFMEIPLVLNARDSIIYLVDREASPAMKTVATEQSEPETAMTKDVKKSVVIADLIWKMKSEDGRTVELDTLIPWNEISGFEKYSGRMTYETEFTYDNDITGKEILILGDVREFARVELNNKDLGMLMWGPFDYATENALIKGQNILKVEVWNTPANFYSGKALTSGLTMDVSLK